MLEVLVSTSSTAQSAAGSSSSNDMVSTIVIGVLTLVTTVAIMYLIARGPKRGND